jgi:hypothetical protein
MSETTTSAMKSGLDLTDIEGRKAAGLPEIMPIDWLKLDSSKAEKLRAIADVDFTSSTGIRVGRSVSPWPLICAPLSAVEAEHNRSLSVVTDLRNSIGKVKDMPNLYAEAIEALDNAESSLLRSSQRLPITHARAHEAVAIIAEHLYEAGFVARPGVTLQQDGPEVGV